ncbi:tetratricopeptide repeat protein [Kordiimonas sp.]|uniref:tetratricopeptide repeat protein n=1 Tax=Kordiimonas sp. TaxID=1970157 RepID=UPI003A92B4AD
MKTLLLSTALTVFASPVFAQSPTVGTEHRPNEHTVACLEAPTRDCAFTAALQTVINEEFGIERAKVLIGVARSMIDTGQIDQAKQTLMLALDEARSVRLTLVTQEKITEIAPLMARAGDVAAGLALVEELQNESIKDTTLTEIAEEAIKSGQLADARVALAQVSNRSKAFWRELSLLSRAPRAALAAVNLKDLEVGVRALERIDQQYRGLVQLAVVADRKGDAAERNGYLTEADEMFSGVIGIGTRADVTAQRVRTMYDAGMDPAFVRTSYDLAILHGDRLREEASQADFASKIGAVEAGIGYLDAALDRLSTFKQVDAKATYLSSLRTTSGQEELAGQFRDVLSEVGQVQGAYERDIVRLSLLEGALGNADINLARNIVRTIEDDDNQALALALMAPLLD